MEAFTTRPLNKTREAKPPLPKNFFIKLFVVSLALVFDGDLLV